MDDYQAKHLAAWANHARGEAADATINAILLYLYDLDAENRKYVLDNWSWYEIETKAFSH